ncbi:MAG: nucleoside deaminase [Gammaproteobacteria bacterium]|nr:nucleoside deaminase [Gammaproteobacteria bacterium]
MQVPQQFSFQLPAWIAPFLAEQSLPQSDRERMALVLAAARRNIDAQSGGPFAAALFSRASGELLALGVNLVPPTAVATLHAEMVAIALAQQQLHCYDLRQIAAAPIDLYSSSEPCAMCLGAVVWSGVARLLFATNDTAVRAIGFDEGDKPDHWPARMAARGITVEAGLLQAEGEAILHYYQQQGGVIYNSKSLIS